MRTYSSLIAFGFLIIAGLAANFQGVQNLSEQLIHSDSTVSNQLLAHQSDQDAAHRGSGRKDVNA